MARRRDYSYISPCIKWTLFFFNFIFWLFGMLIIAIGLYGVVFTAQDLNGLKSVQIAYIVITDLSGVMVALGSIIFIVSFAGCVGALRENLCLLKLYFWCLTIFLIAELLFAIACIIFPWKSREIIESVLSKRLIVDYEETANTKNFVDYLQREVWYCFEGRCKYEVINQGCICDTAIALTLMDSMCGFDMQSKKPHEASDTIYTGSCVTSIIQFLESNLYWAAGVIFGITLFQMYVTHQARSLMDQISLQRSRWSAYSRLATNKMMVYRDYW
nr:tetraspanin-33-like [Cherax quadricarinatus]